MRRTATVEQAVRVLNEALKADPNAVNLLFAFRANCNDVLAGHKTIQVAAAGQLGPDRSVGLLGIINGIFGIDDDKWGAIVASYVYTCGCKETPDSSVPGQLCEGCDEVVYLGMIQGFSDNGREVGHE